MPAGRAPLTASSSTARPPRAARRAPRSAGRCRRPRSLLGCGRRRRALPPARRRGLRRTLREDARRGVQRNEVEFGWPTRSGNLSGVAHPRWQRVDRASCHLPACPRLVEWREQAAADPPRRFQGEDYWARPVPGFGDPAARILVVGLAPAAHGANRTGRMFTGDRSGDWLYAAHAPGRASRASRRASHARRRAELRDAYVTAVVRCAPPANKPDAGRARQLPAVSGEELDCCSSVRVARLPWRVRLGRDAARARERGDDDPEAAAEVRPRRRGRRRRLLDRRLVPPEPAEHVHGPAHRADARRRLRASRADSRAAQTIRPVGNPRRVGAERPRRAPASSTRARATSAWTAGSRASGTSSDSLVSPAIALRRRQFHAGGDLASPPARRAPRKIPGKPRTLLTSCRRRRTRRLRPPRGRRM